MRSATVILALAAVAGCCNCPKKEPKPTPQQPTALRAPGPDGKQYPVIARLQGRNKTITIMAGPECPLYSASTPGGVALVSAEKLDVLKDKYPEIYREVQSAVAADPSLVIDASESR